MPFFHLADTFIFVPPSDTKRREVRGRRHASALSGGAVRTACGGLLLGGPVQALAAVSSPDRGVLDWQWLFVTCLTQFFSSFLSTF